MLKPFGYLRPQVGGSGFIQYGKYNEAEFNALIADNYIPISTPDELVAIRNVISQTMGVGSPYEGNYTTGYDKKYLIYQPLSMVGISWSEAPYTFTGIFDGNEVLINSLTSNSANSVSLLGASSSATLVNIRCNVNFSGSNGSKSAIGFSCLNSTVENCISTGTINSTTSIQSGGMFVNFDNSIVNNSSVQMTISVLGRVGGFASVIKNSSVVSNCFSDCIITAHSDTNTGGFVDEISNATVENCYSLGSINAIGGTTLSYTGGFVGINTSNSIINQCYSECNVYHEGNFYVGVFIGRNISGIITDCYSNATVETTGAYSGGFYGRNDGGINSIVNCYHTGLVTVGSNPQGGFGGNGDGTLNCYYDTDTTGYTTSAGGIGKTTIEMQNGSIPDATIYVGWSNLIWNAVDNSSYPVLINTP